MGMKRLRTIVVRNRTHGARVKRAQELTSEELEIIMIEKKQEELANLLTRLGEINEEAKAIKLKTVTIETFLAGFGAPIFKSSWEILAHNFLRKLQRENVSPIKAHQVAEDIKKSKDPHSIEDLRKFAAKALTALAERGIIDKNEIHKTYTMDQSIIAADLAQIKAEKATKKA